MTEDQCMELFRKAEECLASIQSRLLCFADDEVLANEINLDDVYNVRDALVQLLLIAVQA